MRAARELIEPVGQRSQFIAKRPTRSGLAVAENAHAGEVVDSHRVEWAAAVDRS